MPIYPEEWGDAAPENYYQLPPYNIPYEQEIPVDVDDMVFITTPGEYQYIVCDVMRESKGFHGETILDVSPWDTMDVIRLLPGNVQKLPNRKTLEREAEDYIEDQGNSEAVMFWSEPEEGWNTSVYEYIVHAVFGDHSATDGAYSTSIPIGVEDGVNGWAISKKKTSTYIEYNGEIPKSAVVGNLKENFAQYVPVPVRDSYFKYMKEVIDEEYTGDEIPYDVTGSRTVYYKPIEEP